MSTLLERHAGLLCELSAETGVEVRVLQAVLMVEAAGLGLVVGRPVIRLEVHKLWRGVPVEKRAAVDARFHVAGPQAWEGHQFRRVAGGAWVQLHTSQALEWEAFAVATAISSVVAIESTSWGCGQILGIHWKALGYGSAALFLEAMHYEVEQVRQTVRLFGVMGLVDELRARDWYGFARTYNGPGKPTEYAEQMADAYKELGG